MALHAQKHQPLELTLLQKGSWRPEQQSSLGDCAAPRLPDRLVLELRKETEKLPEEAGGLELEAPIKQECARKEGPR